MTDIVIAGIGQTPVGEHWEISLRELATMAISAARKDSGGLKPEMLFVGNSLAPAIIHQAHLGALLADHAGLVGIDASTIEAGGASGAAALRTGVMAMASGAANVVLVLGVEKMTDQVGASVEAALATTTDGDWESVQGMTPTAQAALIMRRYLHEHNPPRSAFASVPMVAHANARTNSNAMYHNAITAEAYDQAGMVSDPLNIFDIAPNADGAAALLLTRPELLPPNFPHPLVHITGSGMATDTLALHDRPDPLAFNAARLSVERACRQAGILPRDVDFFELYDSFSIYAILALEAAGFAKRGQGWQLLQNDGCSLKGALPIATLGGLKARGNPGGATGVYQAVEAALQLRGEAGSNQVPGAQRALIQSLSGPAASAVTHVLEIYNQ